jgi:hypothetical protein
LPRRGTTVFLNNINNNNSSSSTNMLRFLFLFFLFSTEKPPQPTGGALQTRSRDNAELGKNVNKSKANSVKVALPISSGRISRHLYSSFFNKPAKDE